MSSPTPTSSAPPAATTSGQSGGGSGPPASSPLLFFVALGFGVVFTNLWIIVGVKYCFRYNQRNRQLRAEENGDIDMANMPRPHRRRREKKLMSMDEVNERFPLTKYRACRKSRENEGLPAVGGVTAPASRAASLRNVAATSEPTIPESTGLQPKPHVAEPAGEASVPVADKRFSEASELEKAHDHQTSTDAKPISPVPDLRKTTTAATSMAEDDEDDDHIQTAVPPELLTNPGDSCAICLDTLEDEDDVRGLTCGHAFHAPCLDPWLTNRRACCPLCKADYFVPKPRPEGEEGSEERTGRRHGAGTRMPTAPQGAWTHSSGPTIFRTRMIIPGRNANTVPAPAHDRYGFPVVHRNRRNQRQTDGDASYTVPADGAAQEGSEPAPAAPTWRSRFSRPFQRAAPVESQGSTTTPPPEVSFSTDPTTTPAQVPENSEAARRPWFNRFRRERTQAQDPERAPETSSTPAAEVRS